MKLGVVIEPSFMILHISAHKSIKLDYMGFSAKLYVI